MNEYSNFLSKDDIMNNNTNYTNDKSNMLDHAIRGKGDVKIILISDLTTNTFTSSEQIDYFTKKLTEDIHQIMIIKIESLSKLFNQRHYRCGIQCNRYHRVISSSCSYDYCFFHIQAVLAW